MNTATRVIAQSRMQTAVPSLSWISRPRLVNLLFILAILTTAFSIIYVKDLNRRFFIHYQALQTTHDKLYEEWGKLLLEQSTWSTQARIQALAKNHLDMNLPSPKEVVLLKH